MNMMRVTFMLFFLGLAGLVSANPEPIYPVAFLNLGYNQGSLRAAFSGTLAYTVGTRTFQVYDLNEPTAPIRLYTGSAGAGQDVAAYGRYALTVGFDRVKVIDVADPYAPIVVGTLEGTNGGAARLAISSHYLFVTTGGSGRYGVSLDPVLRVVDISVPTAPEEVGSLAFPEGVPRGIAIAGQYAYVAIDGGMAVVDISRPTDPMLIAEVPLSSAPTYGVAVKGNHAYVTSHGEWCDVYEGCFWTRGTLHVIDIIDPLCPTVRSTIGTLQAAEDIAVAGSFAFIVEQSIGYSIHDYNFLEVNIADPENPEATRYLMRKSVSGSWPSTAQGVAVVGDYVFQPMTKGAFVFEQEPENLPSCNP
jgi:hypothetical protein